MTNNYELSYEELLDLTKVYKCLNELSTDIMNIYSQI